MQRRRGNLAPGILLLYNFGTCSQSARVTAISGVTRSPGLVETNVMRIPLLMMATSSVGILIAAVLGYRLNGPGEVADTSGMSLLLLVFSGLVFFAGRLMAVNECRRRGTRGSDHSSAGEGKK